MGGLAPLFNLLLNFHHCNKQVTEQEKIMWNLHYQSKTVAKFSKAVAFNDDGIPYLELVIEFDTNRRTCFLQVWSCGIPETEPQFMGIQQGVAFLMQDGTTAKDVLEEIGNVS
jgi:hypothetical protein